MERRGFFTRRGDALRGDIVMPSIVYESIHTTDVVEQQEQAVMDVVREAARRSVSIALEVAADGDGQDAEEASLTHLSRTAMTPVVVAAGDAVPIETADLPAGWASPPPRPSPPEHASLMAKFEAALTMVPVTPEAKEVFFSLLKFVQAIERALRALSNLSSKLLRHEEDTGRRVTAKLDTEFELDRARRARAAAEQQRQQWEADHPWRMLRAKALNGSAEVDHPEWLALSQEVQRRDRHVQELKGAIQSHGASLVELQEQEASLQTLRTRSKAQLTRAVDGLVELGPTYGPTLLTVAPEGQRGWLELVLASAGPNAASGGSTQEKVPPALSLPPPRLKPALQRRAP